METSKIFEETINVENRIDELKKKNNWVKYILFENK